MINYPRWEKSRHETLNYSSTNVPVTHTPGQQTQNGKAFWDYRTASPVSQKQQQNSNLRLQMDKKKDFSEDKLSNCLFYLPNFI